MHSDCLTILLALSFAPKGDFAVLMSQRTVFEVYQTAFLRNCDGIKSTGAEKLRELIKCRQLSEYVILLQKLTQAEPHAVVACVSDRLIQLLEEVAAEINEPGDVSEEER